MRVLKQCGLLAPLRMTAPEFFANMRKLEPGINGNRMAVASFYQFAKILVASGVRLIVMPRRDVQGGDARAPPPLGEIIHINAQAVRRIEKRPQRIPAKRRRRSHLRQRLRQIREPFVALYTGSRRNPQNRAIATPYSRHQRRFGPTFSNENARTGTDFKDR